MKVKKTRPLLPVLVCLVLSFYAPAQERLWVVSPTGDLYSMNPDGSDVFSKSIFGRPEFGSYVGAFGQIRNALPSTAVGFAYLGTREIAYGGNAGAVSLLGPTGLSRLYELQYLQDVPVEGIVDGPDGIYFPAIDMFIKWRGIINLRYTGGFELHIKRNTDFSREYKMIMVDGVVYGVSSGDSNNNGFVYRITPDELSSSFVTRIYTFTGGDSGLRPTGRLSYGNGFLFGTTSKGGAGNKGVFFKVRTDGSGYKKLFDLATTSLTKQDANGKFQTLLDVIAEGYVPVADQAGNYFVFDGSGIFRVSPSGFLISKISDVLAEKIEMISPPAQHVVKLLSVPNHATNVSTHFSAEVTNFIGAGEYQLQLSTSPDFSTNVTTLSSATTNLMLDLQSNTTYYTRARTDLWPYFGEVVSFTTENSAALSSPRLYLSHNDMSLFPRYDFWFSVNSKTADDRFDFDATYFTDYLHKFALRQLSNGDKIIVTHGYDTDNDYSPFLRLTPDGLTKLYNLDYLEDEFYSQAMIEGDDGYLYSLKYSVNSPHIYAIFRYKADGTSGQETFRFYHPDLLTYAQLTKTPLGIYGVSAGRQANKGFIFKFKNDLSGIDIVHQFSATAEGTRPQGEMVLGQDGFLYGTTRGGGQYDVGVIFRMSLTGDQYSVLHHFYPSSGKNPEHRMIQDTDGTLYGVTPLGGKNSYGVLFKIQTDGTGYQKLFDFYTSGGKNPSGDFVIDDEFIYSLSEKAGLFRINKDGSGYQAFGIIAQNVQLLPPTASNISIVVPADGADSVDRDTRIELSPMPGASWYSIQLSESPIFGTGVEEIRSSVPSFDVSNLLVNKTYYVRARCSLSEAYGRVSSFTTKGVFFYTKVIDPPDHATNVGTLTSNGVDVDFTFYDLPGATSYRLELFLESQFEYGPFHTAYSNGSDPHASLHGLHENATYLTRVTTNLSPFSGQETYFTTASAAGVDARRKDATAFPNPFTSVFSVQPGNDKIVSATITDATGLIVEHHQKLYPDELFKMGEGLKRGIYILKLKTEAGESVIRLVKE